MKKDREPAKTTAPRAPRTSGPGEVRLIGGRWKRSKLPVADRPGLRPTPDRVRETLFNWLGQDLQGWQVLDAFAGSGALGFEAASRDASRVCLIEQDAGLITHLRQARERLQAEAVEVVRADALDWMRRAAPASFDLVLLDPPFAGDLFLTALRLARGLLRPGGFIYLEADRVFEVPVLAAEGLNLWRQGRAGMVCYHLLTSEYTETVSIPTSDASGSAS